MHRSSPSVWNALAVGCLLALTSGCVADVSSGAFYGIKIGQAKPRVADGLRTMGIGRVRLVPRGSAIGIESQEIDDAQLVDLTEPTSHERLMLTDYGAWKFQYNDRLGDRAVRLEFDGVVLSRIHVRWYPPSSYFFGAAAADD